MVNRLAITSAKVGYNSLDFYNNVLVSARVMWKICMFERVLYKRGEVRIYIRITFVTTSPVTSQYTNTPITV